MLDKGSVLPTSFLLMLLISCIASLKACDHVIGSTSSEKLSEKLIAAERYYETKNYNESISLYEEIVLIKPDCVEALYMLGKSYGRLAQHSSWLKAINYAKKTRKAFEKAHSLNPASEEIKRDLIEFYREAPRFLGGSDKKAQILMAK